MDEMSWKHDDALVLFLSQQPSWLCLLASVCCSSLCGALSLSLAAPSRRRLSGLGRVGAGQLIRRKGRTWDFGISPIQWPPHYIHLLFLYALRLSSGRFVSPVLCAVDYTAESSSSTWTPFLFILKSIVVLFRQFKDHHVFRHTPSKGGNFINC